MDDIREAVKAAYSAAAENPSAAHPFPTGRPFAESIGYTTEALNGIPDECVAAFAGVSNISMTAPIAPGSVVLDLGCGSGVDSLIAARRVGSSGRVIGIDFSAPMLARARDGLAKAGIGNVTFHKPMLRACLWPILQWTLALANGIFNLNPAREAMFRELARVVRPGGLVYAAELLLAGPMPEADHTPSDWFA
jgi:SAM-dependent methyltransferase